MSLSSRSLAGLADDLPFLPIDPYEYRPIQLAWRAGVLALLVVLAYLATLSGEWLWQDEAAIASNLQIRTPGGLAAIWSDPFGGPGQASPLAATLWWLEYRPTSSLSAGAVRVTGLALHAWACIALWLSLRRLNVSGAWLIAAVIAVHPAFVPIVAWPSQLDAVLGAALAASALLALLRARDVEPPIEIPDDVNAAPLPDEFLEPRAVTWIGFWTCAVLTPLADPLAAVVLAAVLPLVTRQDRNPKVMRAIRIASAVLLIAGLAAGVWQAMQRVVDVGVQAGSVEPGGVGRAVEAIGSVPASVIASIAPIAQPMVQDRADWTVVSLATVVIIGLCLLAALVFAATAVARRSTASAFALTAIAAAAIAQFTAIATRQPPAYVFGLLVYIVIVATTGLAIGAGVAYLRATLDPAANRAARWLLGVALVGGLGWLTFARAQPFATQEAFWSAALARDPQSLVARAQFADHLIARGDAERAGTILDAADDSERTDVGWLLARARAYDVAGQPDAALARVAEAYQRAPDRADVAIALAEAQRRAGRPNAAIVLYETFLRRNPNEPSIHNNLGLAHAYAGELDRAITAYEEAIRLDPDYIAARLNLANVLFDVGRFEESSAQLKQAIAIDDRSFAAYMIAGSMLYRLQQHAEAERMFRAAAALDPESADALDRLGIALAAQGKLREAVWSFTRATRLNPGDQQIQQRRLAAQEQLTASTSRPAAGSPPR